MQRAGGRLLYSASDLNEYLECKRLTELEALVTSGRLARPHVVDERAALIRRKGDEHELRYLDGLVTRLGNDLVQFGRTEPDIENYRQAERETLAAMRSGAHVIYQATFFDGAFVGHADFLRRIEVPSGLGEFSYEVIDTKLALHAKPYFLVQLCNYSEHLERLQGCLPEFGYVVLGSGSERRFRLHDYIAYYRHLKAAFLAFAARSPGALEYPYVCKHCTICAWNDECAKQRTADDHLSLVAGMRRAQGAKLERAGIARVVDLAEAGDDRRPPGLNPETFVKLRRQAALQVRGRTSMRPIYELLAHEPQLGFSILPAPAVGDVFFDMEGDPLFEPGKGLEYLFGCWLPDDDPSFRVFWGVDRPSEKHAFESFVDFIVERRHAYPGIHVYHYANYEKSALRRLAQAHCTRENEVDDLLREEVLVDLFAVVRQTLAISEDGYGLKKLERFYDLDRATDVRKGDESIVMFERWLADGDRRILDDIEAYNRDDCRSTQLLRDWLLERRDEAIVAFGIELPFRPLRLPGAPCHTEFAESCKTCIKRRDEERDASRRSELERALLENVLPPQSEDEYRLMNPERRMRYMLANLLAYHRREEKPAWWEYFDRCDNVDRLLEFDKAAIGGLRLREDVPVEKTQRSFVYTFEFPDQPHKMSSGEAQNPRTRQTAGNILSINDENQLRLKTTLGIESARAIAELIPPRPFVATVQRAALARIGQSLLDRTLAQVYAATHDLLVNRNPRVPGRESLQPDPVTAEAVSAIVAGLDRSYLFVQGPPGSGKSTIGSHVICDLLQRGQRVAVTSTSHAAIHNLLRKVETCMAQRGGSFRGRYKHSLGSPDSEYVSPLSSAYIVSEDSNEAFGRDDYELAGGTSWLFTRPELDQKFDYIFIDEAGQVALADALAIALCARNVVLLGDPSQLAQVSQGRQPLHVGDSVLQYVLGDAQTVQRDRGIFLDLSYRMQPEICAFISEAMYENRLRPAESTRDHGVMADGRRLAGLYHLAIEHSGNSSSSAQEADAIVERIASLRLPDRDVIVVTPYNAQRALISRKLREAGIGVRVGTVDKFQGQEAAVVFYSMATSSGEDLPREMEFLFERNRFNVAISRARAASILVYNPRLLDLSCRTPEEMALLNLLCAFVERADPLD